MLLDVLSIKYLLNLTGFPEIFFPYLPSLSQYNNKGACFYSKLSNTNLYLIRDAYGRRRLGGQE